MRLFFILFFAATTANADSSSLALSLPNPPMNYQSDSFSSGNLRCSNAVGGGVNLEYGITGVLSGLETMSKVKDVGVYARIVIPLDKPRSRINCDDLYQIDFFDYSATDKHKSALSRLSDAGASVSMSANRWASTAAITSITMTASTGTFSAGATFHLYGIAKAL